MIRLNPKRVGLLLAVFATSLLFSPAALANLPTDGGGTPPSATRAINIDAGSNGIPEAQVNQAQVTSVFNGVIMVAAALAVVFIVFGGIKYSTSQGNPGETQKAKDTIVYALVGLVIAMLSFGIVQLFTLKVF